MRLDYESVNTSNRFFVAHEGLAIGEVVSGGWNNLGAKDLGYFISEVLVRTPTHDH
jgi:hypothetical protein